VYPQLSGGFPKGFKRVQPENETGPGASRKPAEARSKESEPIMAHANGSTTSKEATPDDFLLTPEETSDILKVAPQTLANWRSQGKGPSWVKLGSRRCRYRRSEIDRFIEAMTVTADH
jgi:predicted DNA-binding transcriptional regulator AlpA